MESRKKIYTVLDVQELDIIASTGNLLKAYNAIKNKLGKEKLDINYLQTCAIFRKNLFSKVEFEDENDNTRFILFGKILNETNEESKNVANVERIIA